GMQAIPATGTAMGIQYRELEGLDALTEDADLPIVVCSLGDASVTEGEVAEAFQMAGLKQLPILFLVQDNGWDISARKEEIRAQNAYEYIKGFKGVEGISIDGTDFEESYKTIQEVYKTMRKERRPFLVHADVPILNHHTSGVRMDFYRDDLEEHQKDDPYPKMIKLLQENDFSDSEIEAIELLAKLKVKEQYQEAYEAEDPKPEDLFTHDFAPTEITAEKGERSPKNGEEAVMVDCAIHA